MKKRCSDVVVLEIYSGSQIQVTTGGLKRLTPHMLPGYLTH